MPKDKNKDFRDQLKVEGVNARGYGIVPKMVMLDRKLTIEAKSIYAYFCSYAGAGTIAFPSREKICKDLCIGKTRFYNHFKLLTSLGYIDVKQKRTDKGQFKHNIYTLVTNPEAKKEEKGPVDNSDEVSNIKDNSVNNNQSHDPVSVENTSFYPSYQNEDTDIEYSNLPSNQNEDTGNWDTDSKDTNNNNLIYNQQFLYNQSIKKDRLTERTNISELGKKYSSETITIAMKKANKAKQAGTIINNLYAYLNKVCQEVELENKILKSNNSSKGTTRFHNFNQRTDKYTNEELEIIVRKKQKEYDLKIENENKRLRELQNI